VGVIPVPAALDVGLRPWGLEDAEELAAMYAAAAPELRIEEPWCGSEFLTADGQRERVRRCLADSSAEGFVITVSGTVAGHLSLSRIRRDILQSADLGYWVAPRERHRGTATRAIGLEVMGVTHDLALVGGGWGDGRLYQLTADRFRARRG